MARVLAVAVLLLYARRWVPQLPAAVLPVAQGLVALVPALAAVWLWRAGGRPWPGLRAAA